jgi:hypothetical protein
MDLGAPNARAKVVKRNKKTNPHSLQIASADGKKLSNIGNLNLYPVVAKTKFIVKK